MITREFVDYIKSEQARGIPLNVVKETVLKEGWTEDDFNEALKTLSSPEYVTHPVPQAVTLGHAYPANTSRKRTMLISFIVLFLLIGGGVYAYVSGYFVSLERVTTKAFENSRDAKSSSFDITITVDSSGLKKSQDGLASFIPELSTDTIKITSKGAYDVSDAKNMKLTGQLSLILGVVNATIDVRATNGVFYAQLSKAPKLGFIPLSQYENKWVAMPYNQDDSESTIKRLSSVIPMLPIDSSSLDSLTSDQKEHLYEMTRNAHLIKIVKKLSPETVGGTLSYHFTFDLDREGIKTYLKNVNDYIHSVGKNDSFLSSLDVTSYGSTIDMIKTWKGEAWIGISDRLPHKLSIEAGIAPEGIEGEIKISIVTIMDNWNKPVTVHIPSPTMTFEQLMSSAENSSSGEVTIPSQQTYSPEMEKDTQRQNWLSSFRAQAELFSDNNSRSYKGFCTSHSDVGAYVLAIKLPQNTDYKCKDSSQAWVSWAKLTTGEYYCVDSTGTAKIQSHMGVGFQCE